MVFSLVLSVSVQAGISDPGEIGGLYVRLEADSLGLTDGAAVTSWTDSASDYEFTGTAAYDADYANGHGAVSFDGIGDMLASTGWTGAPSTGNVTLFVVANFTTAEWDGTSEFIISGQYPEGSADNRLRLLKHGVDGKIDVTVGDGSTITNIIQADTQQHVFAIVSGQTGNAVDFLMDGTVLKSGSNKNTQTPVVMQALGLGGYLNGNNQFADCSIAEVLLYDHALTTQEVADVTDYLQAKYVPEPASMFLLGLGGLAVLKRRK